MTLAINKRFGAGGGGGGLTLPITPGANQFDGVVIDYPFPTGQAGNYSPNLGDTQVLDSGVSQVYAGTMPLDVNGYLTSNPGTTWQSIHDIVLPVRPANSVRIWQVDGYWTQNATPTSGWGWRWLFNYADSNNYWLWRMDYSGQYWQLRVDQNLSGTYYNRAFWSMDGTLRWPYRFTIECMEDNQSLSMTMNAFETDNPGFSPRGDGVTYTRSTNRENYTSTRAFMSWKTQTASVMAIRGYRIRDIFY